MTTHGVVLRGVVWRVAGKAWGVLIACALGTNGLDPIHKWLDHPRFWRR